MKFPEHITIPVASLGTVCALVFGAYTYIQNTYHTVEAAETNHKAIMQTISENHEKVLRLMVEWATRDLEELIYELGSKEDLSAREQAKLRKYMKRLDKLDVNELFYQN